MQSILRDNLGGAQTLNIAMSHLDKFAYIGGFSGSTGGRGQPTLTIMALASRAGEHMARMARAGELG